MERGLRRQKGKMLNEMPDERLDAGEKQVQIGMAVVSYDCVAGDAGWYVKCSRYGPASFFRNILAFCSLPFARTM